MEMTEILVTAWTKYIAMPVLMQKCRNKRIISKIETCISQQKRKQQDE
jgi:hypothetical protein